jgi:calcineurin-like phosphoesterase family protein
MLLRSTSFTAPPFERTLAWFEYTLGLQERPRPDIHGTMLRLADPEVIFHTSQALHDAWHHGERVWLTADLHLGHRNVLSYCDRPFADTQDMDTALVRQLGKVGVDDWLVIVGDVALGDHTLAFPLLRAIPGRKVLVVGNHDITRSGQCHYRDALQADGTPVFEAIVPFLYWEGHADQQVVVSHYPLQLPQAMGDASVDRRAGRDETDRPLPLVNYHGHLHRDQWPPTARIQYVNVGWDVTQGLVCL